LLLAVPALCADSASLNNLLREISCLHCLLTRKELFDEPLQYVDIAAWQNELFAEKMQKQEESIGVQNISSFVTAKLPNEKQPVENQYLNPNLSP